ncbi:hypothetical protein BJ912DRAFT_1068344 [Pholiota molesta]|nr:hypothetical protein BJ912DRAFT_1068344 [Pholiota molesta]
MVERDWVAVGNYYVSMPAFPNPHRVQKVPDFESPCITQKRTVRTDGTSRHLADKAGWAPAARRVANASRSTFAYSMLTRCHCHDSPPPPLGHFFEDGTVARCYATLIPRCASPIDITPFTERRVKTPTALSATSKFPPSSTAI